MPESTAETHVDINSESDIVKVRKTVRDLAAAQGFGPTDVTRIVTAASELARNVFRFAGTGFLQMKQYEEGPRRCLELLFEDQGPGIADIEQAMEPGFTSGGGLGLGLPGAKRLMDELELDSVPGRGTRVTVRKWMNSSQKKGLAA